MSRIVANALGLFALLLVAWFSRHYLEQFFSGPELVLNDERLLELAQQVSEQGRMAYIELRDRELIETGLRAVGTSGGSEYASNPYHLIVVGERYLLVMSEAAADGSQLVGPLQAVTAPVDREVWQTIREENPELNDRLLPAVLNAAAAFKVIGYLGLGLGVPLAALLLFNLVRHATSSPSA